MNNSQFRRLILENSNAPKPSSSSSTASPGIADVSSTPSSFSSPALGSRARSSIPMTPRSVSNGSYASEFARQVAESKRPAAETKFKSAAAPKGTKLARGYVDRTALRREAETGGRKDEDAEGRRIKALEDLVRLGQIDGETFLKMRREITGQDLGGDLETTHLVKGLDWKLLERARKGEDLTDAEKAAEEEEEEAEREDKRDKEPEIDVDDEFEKLEDREVRPVVKEERGKKGSMAAAPPPAIAGKKRTRDEILKELKARGAGGVSATEAKPSQPSLGSKFRRIGEKGAEQSKRFVETDGKGRRREVMITVDEDGKQKRKVRYLDSTDGPHEKLPNKVAKPLGMEVPEYAKNALVDENEDGDIFEGVGADYDPLAGGEDEDDSSEDEQDGVKPVSSKGERTDSGHDRDRSTSEFNEKSTAAEPPLSKTRNYFGTTTAAAEPPPPPPPAPFQDPTLLAAIKKASTLHGPSEATNRSSSSNNAADAEAALRRKKLLESAAFDRDAQDMDMGFGSSKFGDEEDESFLGDGGGKKGGRKRGPKKRKGDKDSASDVLGVLDRMGKS